MSSAKPTLFTICGQSCSGKSTLEADLRELGFRASVSHTTRAPRSGEVHGEHYHFISEAEFALLEHTGAFIETSPSVYGRRYGTTAAQVLHKAAAGAPLVIVCEPVGRQKIRRYCAQNGWHHVAVFVDAHPAVLAARLVERMARDLAAAVTPDQRQQVIDSYSRRLGGMMGEETHWADDLAAYDIVVESYTPTTERSVQKQLLEQALVLTESHGWLTDAGRTLSGAGS